MNKFLLLSVLIIFSVSIGYFLGGQRLFEQGQRPKIQSQAVKKPILRVALVADSHNENELLAKALSQAGGKGVNFVIGLGDYTNVGTVEELRQAREVFDRSKLEYLVTVGDHDLWDSRNRGEDPLTNFREVFDDSTRVLEREGIQFVILDNSDIYSGIDSESWKLLNDSLSGYIGQDGQTSENVKCQMCAAEAALRFCPKNAISSRKQTCDGQGFRGSFSTSSKTNRAIGRKKSWRENGKAGKHDFSSLPSAGLRAKAGARFTGERRGDQLPDPTLSRKRKKQFHRLACPSTGQPA